MQATKDAVFQKLLEKHTEYKAFAMTSAMDWVKDPDNVRWLPQSLKFRLDGTDRDPGTEEEAPQGVYRPSTDRLYAVALPCSDRGLCTDVTFRNCHLCLWAGDATLEG